MESSAVSPSHYLEAAALTTHANAKYLSQETNNYHIPRGHEDSFPTIMLKKSSIYHLYVEVQIPIFTLPDPL